MNPHRYSTEEIAAVERAIRERRDMRHFLPDPLPDGLVEAAHLAPSVGCAIQNMWLLARAEGVGIGWVSFFDPDALAALLGMPEGARPLAILCIGRVPAFYPRPMFEDTGWGKRLALEEVLFEERWKVGAASAGRFRPDGLPAGGTAPAY